MQGKLRDYPCGIAVQCRLGHSRHGGVVSVRAVGVNETGGTHGIPVPLGGVFVRQGPCGVRAHACTSASLKASAPRRPLFRWTGNSLRFFSASTDANKKHVTAVLFPR